MGNKVRIGLIGAGQIGVVHLKSYLEVENAEIAAICDIDETRLNKIADEYGITNRYTSVEDMLANEKDLDAADVCVWNVNHAKCAIAALNAGLHVICEKPMAYSVQEAEEMKACAEKNGKILMLAFCTRFSDETLIVKDYIDNGYLGNIYYAKAQYVRRHGNPGGWFGNKALSGGGPVIDLGVHVLDRARYLMGKPNPVSVYAVTFEKLGPQRELKNNVGWQPENAKDTDVCDVEDFATALIRFDNGAVIQLETSYDVHLPSSSGLSLCGEKGGMVTGGENLTMHTNINGYISDVNISKNSYKNAGK